MLKGHLPRVIYHHILVYEDNKEEKKDCGSGVSLAARGSGEGEEEWRDVLHLASSSLLLSSLELSDTQSL